MKKILLLLFGACVVSSCQLSENIYINDDGSGKMEFSFDASQMMKTMSEMGDGAPPKGMEKAQDSTIVFKDIIEEKQDSIAKLPEAEQKKFEALKDFVMRIKTDPEKNEMKFDLSTDFKNANELQNMLATLSELSKLDNKSGGQQSNPLAKITSGEATEVIYAFNGTTFKRTSKITDKELHDKSLENMDQANMILAPSMYTINYHFPKPVKSFSLEGAKYNDDRTVVTYQIGLLDYIKNPEVLSFEVTLED